MLTILERSCCTYLFFSHLLKPLQKLDRILQKISIPPEIFKQFSYPLFFCSKNLRSPPKILCPPPVGYIMNAALEESYPKLKESGGFEILRRGPSPSELTLIPPPPSGYTVKFLRDSAGLGQAIAFVRPLQCNLSREAIKPVSDHSQVGI